MNKSFKIVYENWDNNEPITNGSNNSLALHNSYFFKPHEITDLLLKNNNKIESVNLDEADNNSLYFICHFNKIREMVYNNKWILSNQVEEAIKVKNLKIIFFNLHESFENIELDIKILQDRIATQNLPEENFYIINNNSYLDDIKLKLNTKINVYTTKWFIEYVNNSNLRSLEYKENKKFIFLLHNRVPKPHRISLLILLKKLEILNDDVFDWSLLYPQMPFFTPFNNMHRAIDNPYKIFGDKKYFVDIHARDNRAIFRELISKPKLSYFENEKNWFTDMEKHDSSNWNEIRSFEESYINIVTESHYAIKDIHMSEKTFRPFYCFQIPIFAASYNHIKKIREQYPPLDLFDDLINHDYDNEEDDIRRLEMVANEIKRLSENKDMIVDFYSSNKSRFIKNREYVETFSKNVTTLKYFNDLFSL